MKQFVRARFSSALAIGAMVILTTGVVAAIPALAGPECPKAKDEYSAEELPKKIDKECKFYGKKVKDHGIGVISPEPGPSHVGRNLRDPWSLEPALRDQE